jgi:hypothetical protein
VRDEAIGSECIQADRDQDTEGATLLTMLTNDTYRFVMYHKGMIESSPLQAYASALLFSPSGSLVRKLYEHEEPVARYGRQLERVSADA